MSRRKQSNPKPLKSKSGGWGESEIPRELLTIDSFRFVSIRALFRDSFGMKLAGSFFSVVFARNCTAVLIRAVNFGTNFTGFSVPIALVVSSKAGGFLRGKMLLSVLYL